MIKDYDTFEANLVMSTLSPEDGEFERQKSRSLVQFNSQQTNVDIERTDAVVDEAAHNENLSGSSKSRKRNLSTANDSDFEFGNSRIMQLDVLRKKQRTSNDRRDTHLPPPSDTNGTLDQPNPSQRIPPGQIDLESENIDVVFQEDSDQNEPFHHNNNSEGIREEHNENCVNGRDHRLKMRSVFGRCFTGNEQPIRDSPILVEASDEEM